METRICLLTTLQPLSRNKICQEGQKSVTTRGQLTLSMRSLKIEFEMSRKSLSIFTYMFTPYAYITSYIMKTYLYDFDPLKPRFYIVKLGLTGLHIIFLISAQKHRLWLLGEAVLTSTNNLCFEQKYEKYQKFSFENFHLFGGKIFSIFE